MEPRSLLASTMRRLATRSFYLTAGDPQPGKVCLRCPKAPSEIGEKIPVWNIECSGSLYGPSKVPQALMVWVWREQRKMTSIKPVLSVEYRRGQEQGAPSADEGLADEAAVIVHLQMQIRSR